MLYLLATLAVMMWSSTGDSSSPSSSLLEARQAFVRGSADSYRRKRSQADCTFPMDIVLLQDCTGSTADNWGNMKDEQLPLMVQTLDLLHPGTQFGIMCFRDKPIYPYGLSSDRCVVPHGGFTTELSDLQSLYDEQFPYGGSDAPEAQFHAMFAALKSPLYQYRPQEATPLVIMLTDGAPHFEGDGFNAVGLPAFSGKYEHEDPDGQCRHQYYPSPVQVKEAFHDNLTYFAAVVYDPRYQNGLAAKSWNWFVDFIGETPQFTQMMDTENPDFWDKLSEVISELEEYECDLETTPLPTTAATTEEDGSTIESESTRPIGCGTCPPIEECEI
eukprot:Protomagalhaensia_sp_Gyna_25__1926@NODE_2021_length_1341_cov_827_264977_g1667_i0_p1_GENE_NODE_2021_length_1341_cov_827_264977_g1667_i0NODE_2021_length_1341_cov_827_264977_g1667_i0_p1_ORF_typecomplete_len330_score55_85Integrin_beta/PF00362_18/1_5e18VWA/PF00092_28/9_8e07VWA_3/PF13768_6/0_0026VWA_2/PF13519_6/0_005_NODE_2021_length_1341_cov_827_264977_g1667_i02881277